MLARMVESRTAEAIHLNNRISIEVHTASFRAVRGYTIVAVIADEIAFWRDDTTANPDAEVIAALRPGMATVPGALLLGISSPYSRRGVLWEAHRRHYGRTARRCSSGRRTSAEMNPTIDPAVIASRLRGRRGLAPLPSTAPSSAGTSRPSSPARRSTPWSFPAASSCPRSRASPTWPSRDPSGGSSDSMTLAIAHRENGSAVLDAIREVRPPF